MTQSIMWLFKDVVSFWKGVMLKHRPLAGPYAIPKRILGK